MIKCSKFMGGLLAAAAFAGLASAQMVVGGTRHPVLTEVTLSDGNSTSFVVGDGAWGEVLAEMGVMRGEDRSRDREIAEQLYNARNEIPAAYLFEAARRYASFDPDQAVYVFFLARGRALYDALRCLDSTATNGVPIVTDMAGGEVASFMNISDDGQSFANVTRMQAALDRLQENGEIFTGEFTPWWICSASDSVYIAATNSAPMPENEWLKPREVWPSAQRMVEQNMARNRALLAVTIGARELEADSE
ncbi:hypothetical protein [Hyphobacterium sp.]|uniref:hypothetical protein n=1 Tax=Hyphobacterium sp. TaxID=2004662 RepID=UPI0037497791